jgi:poly(3-hydroxybutyrate) depolymerase
MAVVFKPFETDYGYKSPGFSVDVNGNVTVRTITNTYTPPVIPPAPDFNVNETAGAFTFLNKGTAVNGNNPQITVERGTTYTFVLNTSSLAFNIYKPDVNDITVPGLLYSEGLSHANTVSGENLATGSISFTQTWQQQQSGYTRTAQVVVPDTTGTDLEGKKIPVVISLHDEGFTQANGITNVNFISDKILIAPQGYNNQWNVGYQTSKADDIAFIDSIISSLSNYDNVDTREITIIGYGNGGQLALQYSNYSQNASVKHIITFNGLLNVDQYLSTDHSFYTYDLDDQVQDQSTIINWTSVTPLGSKNVLMFNGKDDLNFLYNGGTIGAQEFYSAEDSVYGMARADGSTEDKITTATTEVDGSESFSYDNDAIRLYAFPGVANNFTTYQNTIRTRINTTIATSTYLDIPVATTLTDAEAQGQQSGTLTYAVPVDAPDTLYYGDSDGVPYGTLVVAQPSVIGAGVFSSILDTGDLLAEGQDAEIRLSPTGTGTVTINPATTGTVNNVNLNAQNLSTSGNVSLTPNADVTISPQAGGTLTMRPTDTGLVDNVNIGSVIPRNGTFSTLNSSQGTLNNTTLGLTTAAQAAFTSATVTSDPSNANDVTKKQYVDNTATVLSIALGV